MHVFPRLDHWVVVVVDDDDVLFFKFIKKVLYIYSQISLKGHLAKIDGLPIRRTFLEDGRIAHNIS